MTGSDITIDARYDLEYTQTPGASPIVPRNTIPRLEVRYDEPPGHGDPIQEPIPNGTPAAVTASPGVAVYPPSFNQSLEAYLISGHPLSSSLGNRGVIPPADTTHHNEESRRSTLSQLLDQTNTAGLTRGAGVNHPSRHQCTECDASYARLSGLNRHYKDKHMTWMTCRRCNSEFSLGRMYKFTEHLETCTGAKLRRSGHSSQLSQVPLYPYFHSVY